jgi:hypothetical protein
MEVITYEKFLVPSLCNLELKMEMLHKIGISNITSKVAKARGQHWIGPEKQM